MCRAASLERRSERGSLTPNLPVIDIPQWREGSRSERLKPMVRHIAENGMGNPDVIYIVYTIKIGLYVLGGILFALATKGIDGWSNIGTWWREPIVFQKAVLWSLLFEVVGVGCGFGPQPERSGPQWDRPSTGCAPERSGWHPGLAASR